MTDYAPYLRSVDFFDSLPEEELAKIETVCFEEWFRTGAVICHEGDAADRFFIIIEGTVEFWKSYESEERDMIAINGPGHIFGEMSLVDDKPRGASVVARSDVRLLTITRDKFHQIIAENSSFALSVMKSVSNIVRRNDQAFMSALRERNRALEHANRELKDAQTELLRSERLSVMGKMASAILHEIRSPLSVIRGYAELLRDRPADADLAASAPDKIINEADRIAELASGLLDFSRGKVRLKKRPVNLEDFFSRFVQYLATSVEGRAVNVQTEVINAGPIPMDEERMFRVFVNLATNSSKAMPEGGTFRIRSWREGDLAVFEVSDTGAGIEEDQLESIFEPFTSYSSEGGIGLGMAIVKGTIDAHGGSISISSKPGEGTSVTIFIPWD